jgi:hypothetical protein
MEKSPVMECSETNSNGGDFSTSPEMTNIYNLLKINVLKIISKKLK